MGNLKDMVLILSLMEIPTKDSSTLVSNMGMEYKGSKMVISTKANMKTGNLQVMDSITGLMEVYLKVTL